MKPSSVTRNDVSGSYICNIHLFFSIQLWPIRLTNPSNFYQHRFGLKYQESEEYWLYLATQVSIIVKCPAGLINWSLKCAPGGHMEMPH